MSDSLFQSKTLLDFLAESEARQCSPDNLMVIATDILVRQRNNDKALQDRQKQVEASEAELAARQAKLVKAEAHVEREQRQIDQRIAEAVAAAKTSTLLQRLRLWFTAR